MGFRESGDKIYNVMAEGGQALKWKSEDFVSLFDRCRKLGFRWNSHDGRFDRGLTDSMTTTSPWCHVRPDPRLKCMSDHGILFDHYDIISTRCLNCWKVTVTPRTFDELLTLEKLQMQMDVPCKCGIEVRDYVPKFYGGYFYCFGPEHGLARYKEVREMVDEVISPDVSVILKRGCTEYEFTRGDSKDWNINPEQKDIQDYVDLLITVNNGLLDQPNFVKSHTRRSWMLWAHMNGDMSYMKHNGGKKLFPDYRQYHEMKLEDIKEIINVN